MGFFEKYPNTDFHELNLDWLIAKMKELQTQFDEFKVVNNITFSGQWDITKQYPAWTIVSDNNIGYVSIQPVPVGVVLNNSDYWVEVIDYTAQIAGLQQRVVDIENDLENNVHPDIQSNANDITTLNNVKEYFAGDVVVIGDSYLQGYNPDGNTTSWGIRFKNSLQLGSRYHEYSSGGIGFVHLGNNNGRFEDLIQDAIDDTSFDNENVSLVIIGGGFNDAVLPATQADVNTHVEICRDKIVANFPNAKTIVAWIANAESPSGCTYDKLYNQIGIWGNAVTGYGMSYAGNIGKVLKAGNEAGLASDGTHPTNYGQAKITDALICAIGAGDYLDFQPNFKYSSNNNLYVIADNNNIILDFFQTKNIAITATNIICNGTTEVVDIDLSDLHIKPLLGNNFVNFVIKIMLNNNSGNYYIMDAFLRFKNNGHVSVLPFDINDSNNNFRTVTNCTNCHIYPQIVTVPRIIC